MPIMRCNSCSTCLATNEEMDAKYGKGGWCMLDGGSSTCFDTSDYPYWLTAMYEHVFHGMEDPKPFNKRK